MVKQRKVTNGHQAADGAQATADLSPDEREDEFVRRVAVLKEYIKNCPLPVEQWGENELDEFKRLSDDDSIAIAVALAGPFDLPVTGANPHLNTGE